MMVVLFVLYIDIMAIIELLVGIVHTASTMHIRGLDGHPFVYTPVTRSSSLMFHLYAHQFTRHSKL